MAFVLKQTLKLDEFEGWKDCYIVFSSPTVEEVSKLGSVDVQDPSRSIEASNQILELHFLSGKGYDGEKAVDLKKEDVRHLPMPIWGRCMSFLAESSTQGASSKQ